VSWLGQGPGAGTWVGYVSAGWGLFSLVEV
jgi:hypothetical protein